MIKILDFFGLLLYCLFIYWLSDQPSLPAPMWFAHQDKIHHAGAYFIMGLLAWRSFKHLADSPIILALISIAFCSLFGVSDEWHQSFVEGRFSDIADWIADSSGAGLAILLMSQKKILKGLNAEIHNPTTE
ncbi:MAG: VanZ family protein [Methylobacter sp.]|nr:VanZ family protein [Methylobacter sp.]